MTAELHAKDALMLSAMTRFEREVTKLIEQNKDALEKAPDGDTLMHARIKGRLSAFRESILLFQQDYRDAEDLT